MKRLLLLLVLLSVPAFACTAFYTGEQISGMNKICYYDHLGNTVAYNVKSYELCPINIEVRH